MNDGGLIATLEQWFADELTAIEYESKKIFNVADVWKHQIAATSGGMEAFSSFEPFAFISYQSTEAAREGDYDLRQVFEFAILIGCESKFDGVARFGDENHLGTSKLRDLVIEHFDRKHPGGQLTCDEIYYINDIEIFDSAKRHAIQMTFEVSQLTPTN